MSKKILIPRSVHTLVSTPFSFLKRELGKCFFSGGSVNSLANESKFISSSEIEESEEFYLNIKSNPLSPKIKEVKILNKEEVKETKAREDDLLNIYLPIAKQNSYGEIVNYQFLNSNFNLAKKPNEKKMSGFFVDGKVFISGFILFAPSGEIIETFKNTEIPSKEGDTIFLNINGALRYKPTKKDDFYFQGARITSGGSPFFLISEFSLKDDEEDKDRDLKFSVSFPLGIISNANYIALSRGNIKIQIAESLFRYFSEETDGESIFETRYSYYLIPSFI